MSTDDRIEDLVSTRDFVLRGTMELTEKYWLAVDAFNACPPFSDAKETRHLIAVSETRQHLDQAFDMLVNLHHAVKKATPTPSF
jgi:hypothetical protein